MRSEQAFLLGEGSISCFGGVGVIITKTDLHDYKVLYILGG
jgi:hypothetical protein